MGGGGGGGGARLMSQITISLHVSRCGDVDVLMAVVKLSFYRVGCDCRGILGGAAGGFCGSPTEI